MEFIATKRIGPVGTPDPVTKKVLVAGNSNSNDPADGNNVEFIFPAGFLRWSLVIIPRNAAGSPTPPTVDVKYWTGKDYLSTNPATTATTALNKANTITREDAITKILVNILNDAGGAVNGGVEVSLYGTRITQ